MDMLWGAISVMLGVVLGFGLTLARDRCERRTRVRALKRMTLEELRAIRDQLPIRRHGIEIIRSALDRGKIPAVQCARAPRIVHEQFYPEVSEHFTAEERYSLHVIYEISRIIDDMLAGFEGKMTEVVDRAPSGEAVKKYIPVIDKMLREVLILEKLIAAHLAGDPIDVFDVFDAASTEGSEVTR